MPSIFDGMAGLLNDVFGDPVTFQPVSGITQQVQAVFRTEPIEVTGSDGHVVLIIAPTLRVMRNVLPGIGRGDLVKPSSTAAEGKTFRVLNRIQTASPAVDAFFVCELEEVLP